MFPAVQALLDKGADVNAKTPNGWSALMWAAGSGQFAAVQAPERVAHSLNLPEVTRLVVMMYVRYPLSLRNVEDLLAERKIDISHETVRFWWNRFGPTALAHSRLLHAREAPVEEPP